MPDVPVCWDPTPPPPPCSVPRARLVWAASVSLHSPPSAWIWQQAWAWQSPGSRRRAVGVLVPASPSPQDHGPVVLILRLPSLDSGTCSPPLAQSPAGGTTLLSLPGFLHSPLSVSLILLTPLAVPFVKLSSNYLLLMCHMILAGTLDETPPDSAVSIFNIYGKMKRLECKTAR